MTMTDHPEQLPEPAAALERLAGYYGTHGTSGEMEHGEWVEPQPMATTSLRLPAEVISERRRVRLRPQPDALRRLPHVRPRLRRREQPVAQPGDPVHPRAEDAKRRHVRRGQGGPQLRAEVRAAGGLLLHADV